MLLPIRVMLRAESTEAAFSSVALFNVSAPEAPPSAASPVMMSLLPLTIVPPV
jgi:hypothetical protein